MPTAIAIICTDLKHTRLGLPSRVSQSLAGQTVLQHTVNRIAQVRDVTGIVLLHPPDQDPMAWLDQQQINKPIDTFADPDGLTDRYHAMRTTARKWALTAWRGGLGATTCYDELLPAKPILAAMQHHQADGALIVGADWPLVDPGYCSRVLELHLRHPQAMQFTFTQAPPGLAGVAVSRELISQLAQANAGFSQILGYTPTKPQSDPIGRDVCIQIPASVRACDQRFIYDTPRTGAMIDAIANDLGQGFTGADAPKIAAAYHRVATPGNTGFAAVPQQVTLELTPQRLVNGPIVVQHHIELPRDPMPLETALKTVEQLGAARDVALTLGGLGDALLYEHWDQVVIAAHQAGVLGIAIETDLLVDQTIIDKLLELPIDIVSVRLNADTAPTYDQVMAPVAAGGFSQVIANLQYLLSQRNSRAQQNTTASDGYGALCLPGPQAALPWVVPRLIKTAQTLGDMETFFDRWVHYAGHAVIDPATTGCGLCPDQSPVQMAGPSRAPCRQVMGRMTIHADGSVPRCDQDWLAKATAGDVVATPVAQLWQAMQPVRDHHASGSWDHLDLCNHCHQWHRP